MENHHLWSVRTVDSFIRQYPLLHDHPLLSDCWNYESGCMLKAIRDVYEMTGNARYLEYIKGNMDQYVRNDGSIRTYRLEDYNLDQINQGKLLKFLYERTGDEHYRKAAQMLRMQLTGQPQTSEGGFWHKKIYPFQMWLDGLYMAAPFLAEYGIWEQAPELLDEAVMQLLLAEQHTRNPQSGLLHHGWDESKEQEWADPVNGRSPHVWGRAVGWYAMAVVDVLDFVPLDHRKRGQVIGVFERMYHALVRVQDRESGLWHQVLGEEGRKGNYMEASGSAMMIYAGLKALRKGYLSDGYHEAMERGFRGMLEHFAEVDESGEVHVHRINRGAGLGGNPYRDGSYTYYIQEEIVTDDPKGVAPFIMACLEGERAGLGG